MKLSKYTILIDDDGQYIAYNTASNSMMVCTREIVGLIRKYSHEIDRIRNIHPSLYDYLKDKNFIVSEEADETLGFIQSLKQELDDIEEYLITINPTMNCNLRCWYCYEEHLAHSNMPEKIIESIKKLIENIVGNPKVKSLHLSFFGGEPLLGFKNCIKPLIEFSDALCRKYDTSFSFGFTTNAVLLSEETCDILARFDREVSMQIPFDGDRPMHDSIKRTATGKGTYDRILTNLKYALSKGFYITVRCNYTTKSAASFRNLVEDIKPLLVTYPSRVRVSFQQVWQDLNQHKANPIIDELESEISNIGAHCYCSDADISRCYADKKNSFVINYDGSIYQCTAREFTDSNKEGVLRADGTIEYNERYHRRMESRFSNPECMECNLYPICNICTQKRLEQGNTQCPGSRFPNFKQDLLLSRIKALYRISQEKQSPGKNHF